MNAPIKPPSSAVRFENYLGQLGNRLRDKRQRASFALYAAGLLSDGERKSMEPMAARVGGEPSEVSALHYRFVNFTSSAAWHDEPIRQFAAQYAIEAMQQQGPINAWIVDDTGFLKQGTRSPGVQRQYTGSAGKRANCQIGVSLVLANNFSEIPVDFRLYIPQCWADDRARCTAAHIPDNVGYQPKWELALEMIRASLDAEYPPGVVLSDSAYGNVAEFRTQLDKLGLQYSVDVHCTTVVRRMGRSGRLGVPMSVKELGRRTRKQFKKLTWREGSKSALTSWFYRVRVAVGRNGGVDETQWLLIERREGEGNDSMHYTLSNLPKKYSCKDLVRTHKNRWRIERSYEDLKGQLGLDHYEGRSFIGWNHHVTVALSCYAFLIAERIRDFPPSGTWASANRQIEHQA